MGQLCVCVCCDVSALRQVEGCAFSCKLLVGVFDVDASSGTRGGSVPDRAVCSATARAVGLTVSRVALLGEGCRASRPLPSVPFQAQHCCMQGRPCRCEAVSCRAP